MLLDRLRIEKAVFAIVLVLTGCGDRSGVVSYRIVQKFTKESLHPHSLGSRALFLEIEGTNVCRLAGSTTNCVQAIDGGKALIFFSEGERRRDIFHFVELVSGRHVIIPVDPLSTIGSAFGYAWSNGGAEVVRYTHTNVVIRWRSSGYDRVYDFNTVSGTFSESSSKRAE